MKILYSFIDFSTNFINSFWSHTDVFVQTLLLFMLIDYLSSTIVFIFFSKSQKNMIIKIKNSIGWRGLCKKGMILFIIMVAEKLDFLLDVNYIMNAACIGYIINEFISIIENAELMGITIPQILKKITSFFQNINSKNDF